MKSINMDHQSISLDYRPAQWIRLSLRLLGVLAWLLFALLCLTATGCRATEAAPAPTATVVPFPTFTATPILVPTATPVAVSTLPTDLATNAPSDLIPLPAPIYFLGNSGQIMRLETNGMLIRRITSEVAPIHDFDVAQTHGRLVYTADNQLIEFDPITRKRVVKVATQRSVQVTKSEPYPHQDAQLILSPRYSPDGTQIIYTQDGINLIASGLTTGTVPVQLLSNIEGRHLRWLRPAAPPSPLAMLTVHTPQTYRDPSLGFTLYYPESWVLDAQEGTMINDSSGRTLTFEKELYQLRIMIQNTPESVGSCGGLFPQDALNHYWHYSIGDLEIWRIKAEEGYNNGISYYDDQVTFLDIISPTELSHRFGPRYIGTYTCSLATMGKILSIAYNLPVSESALFAGDFSAENLAEMDYILTSLVWEDE